MKEIHKIISSVVLMKYIWEKDYSLNEAHTHHIFL